MKPKIISEVKAANLNPPFPRIGQVTFYPIGLVAIRHYNASDARRIKAKNPDVILLATNEYSQNGILT